MVYDAGLAGPRQSLNSQHEVKSLVKWYGASPRSESRMSLDEEEGGGVPA